MTHNHPRRPRARAYVVMPFAELYDPLYSAAIQPAAARAGLAVARYDEIEWQGDVNARIAHGISSADVLVAVVTGRNANVFYEIGFARAIGKTILVLASTREEIPAFLEDLPCVVYGASLDGLRRGLAAAFANLMRADEQAMQTFRHSLLVHG